MNTTKRYAKPFKEFLYQDSFGYFHVRLGPKIYMIKVSLNFTPNFDQDFFGGHKDTAFDWSSVLVKDRFTSNPRLITDEELNVYWFKPNIRQMVNYQRAIKRKQALQSTRHSKEQCLAYRNDQYNRA